MACGSSVQPTCNERWSMPRVLSFLLLETGSQWYKWTHYSSSKEAVTSHSVIASNSTSDNRYNKKFLESSEQSTNSTKEGCFCPEGTTLFNTVYKTCVTSCGKRRSHRKLNLTRSQNIFHKSTSCFTYTLKNASLISNFRLCWAWWETQIGEKWCPANTVFIL